MTWAIAAALILTIASAFGAARLKPKSGLTTTPLGGGVTLADLETLSVEELTALLDRLVSEKEPIPVMGAMCYGASSYPDYAEYTCPACGEKTVYPDYTAQFIEWELQDCRRLFDEISAVVELDIVLDETLFCQFCSESDGGSPSLLLHVTLEDGSVVSSAVSQHDLMLLESFVKGRLFYYTWNDGEAPLKPHADRIRTLLLGIPPSEDVPDREEVE
jgi:hypothetical protein